MAEGEGKGRHGKTWFVGIFALLALVVGYSIYKRDFAEEGRGAGAARRRV